MYTFDLLLENVATSLRRVKRKLNCHLENKISSPDEGTAAILTNFRDPFHFFRVPRAKK